MVEKVISTLRWCRDLESGEMIEAKDYTREYLAFPGRISQKDLDYLCFLVRPILSYANYSFSIANSMGEIVPIARS